MAAYLGLGWLRKELQFNSIGINFINPELQFGFAGVLEEAGEGIVLMITMQRGKVLSSQPFQL